MHIDEQLRAELQQAASEVREAPVSPLLATVSKSGERRRKAKGVGMVTFAAAAVVGIVSSLYSLTGVDQDANVTPALSQPSSTPPLVATTRPTHPTYDPETTTQPALAWARSAFGPDYTGGKVRLEPDRIVVAIFATDVPEAVVDQMRQRFEKGLLTLEFHRVRYSKQELDVFHERILRTSIARFVHDDPAAAKVRLSLEAGFTREDLLAQLPSPGVPEDAFVIDPPVLIDGIVKR